jgi:hypothetical protein
MSESCAGLQQDSGALGEAKQRLQRGPSIAGRRHNKTKRVRIVSKWTIVDNVGALHRGIKGILEA